LLVGEAVYVRDYRGPIIDAARMMLHAATLGFTHPVTGERIELEAPVPEDFVAVVSRLER
jgi:23S rRNA pseudouridine1911/1915/1917 synthase